MYPPARRSDHVDHYFGTAVPDPYRWLEDVDSPETEAWVDAENLLTRSLLDLAPGREALRHRLLALTNFERFSAPVHRNGRYFYSHNTGLQNQAVLHWQQGLDGTPHLLLDPNTLSADGTVALSGISLSDDGTLLAYALAEAGSDWITWRVREVETGNDLPDRILRSKFSGASWLPDASGFFYSGYGLETTPGLSTSTPGLPGEAATPAEAEGTASPTTAPEQVEDPEGTALTPAALKQTQLRHKVFFHHLGTPQSADRTIYQRLDDPELLTGASVTEDGRFLLVTASKGHTNTLAALPLPAALTDSAATPIAIATLPDARYEPVDVLLLNGRETLLLHTTADAANGRVVAVDLANPASEHWQVLLPETRNNLDSVTLVANTLIASYLADAQSLVELYTPAGQPLGQVELPAIGTATGFTGRASDRESFFVFTNFTTPPTILRLALSPSSTGVPLAVTPIAAQEAASPPEIPRPAESIRSAAATPTVYRSPKLTFDPSAFETVQRFYTSKDGTGVPLFLTSKRGLPRNAENPTLLYAYGGFNISLLPAFSPTYLLWMELGGIFAQPSLRGGGEYGEVWHEAGTRTRKQNVFDDFIAAAEFLLAERYTCPRKLAIEGGSNGGLLVAAVALQRPEIFGAALAHVGVLDMLRFDQFTIGYAWRSDYGSPSENEEEFRAILRYSPLHNVRPATAYPPTLILTADHDDRVFPAHSFKFTAEMQHHLAQGQTNGTGSGEASNPTLIRVETRAGHGAGMPLSKRIDQTVDVFSFLARYLNLVLP